MGRKGRSVTIERGISRDDTGYRVRSAVGPRAATLQRELRFPLTVDLPYLRAQRAQLEATLLEELAQRHPDQVTIQRGTLAEDVQTYLRRMETALDPATHRSRASELARWVEVLGHRPRHTIRASDIERAFRAWAEPPAGPRAPRLAKTGRMVKPRPWSPPSPKTILNRVRALTHLYHKLDGARARTPLDDVSLPAIPKRRPKGVTVADIRRVLARLIRGERNGRLRDAKTRARYLVLVTCGQRPAQVMRTTADDVDLERGIWHVPSAKGGEPITLPLNAEQRAAWAMFSAAGAWGSYDTTSFARTLRTAGWPATVQPYQARHSVGITLSEMDEDLGDIQHWLGHAQIQTTRRFYVPGLLSRLRKTADRLDGRVAFTPRWASYRGTMLGHRDESGENAQ